MRPLFHAFLLWLCVGLSARGETAEEPSLQLAAPLDQESLVDIAKRNPKAELYRLTVERSFDPVLVFEIDQDAIYVRKVRAIHTQNQNEFTTSYRLVRNSRIKLESHEYKNFQTLLQAGAFWDLPTPDWQEPGLDGSTWKLEGIKAGKYHCVHRSNPLAKGPESPLSQDVKALSPERALSEGRLVAAFLYLWALSGDANEELY